jgi:1-acyl-sn-glycerol-3-phosphate acyltransferase
MATAPAPSHPQSSQPMAAALPQPSARLRSFFETNAGRTALALITDYFWAKFEGRERIPREGPALIVSNHALFALDSLVLGALIVREVGRYPRFLADRALWKVPGLRHMITAIGGLPGDPRSADLLLRQGELVVVYPGGVDDSLKSNAQRYRLMWKKRAGFARVAMTAGVPIIPIVGLGIDDMYSVLGREHWLGRRLFGSERYDLPVPVGAFGTIVPRRMPQRYRVLAPIDTAGDATSELDVERVRSATYEAIESELRRYREALP